MNETAKTLKEWKQVEQQQQTQAIRDLFGILDKRINELKNDLQSQINEFCELHGVDMEIEIHRNRGPVSNKPIGPFVVVITPIWPKV